MTGAAAQGGRGAGGATGAGAGEGAGGAAGERLQKVLARTGLGSRRACEDLIRAGQVTVNGSPARLGQRIDPQTDRVEVDGRPLGVRPGLVHYLLNKPAGVITSAADPWGRPRVLDLVPEEPRVFPVGRLDADSEGLLVVTNDGELAQHLTHPGFGVEKEYLAQVEGRPSPGALRRLRQGVELSDGLTAPARVALVAPDTVRLVLHEGRNREVRRMCEAVGHPVRRLVRTRIGPLVDRSLAPGQWRLLSFGEVSDLAGAVRARERRGDRPAGGPAGRPENRSGSPVAAEGRSSPR